MACGKLRDSEMRYRMLIGLVEAHGGEIWARSIPGETTSIHFTIPTIIDAWPDDD